VTKKDHFEEFEPHTRLKHLVLQAYLQMWARKLLLRSNAGPIVYYIDACAGRGMDDVGNRGSPVLAAREAAILEGQFRDQFSRNVRLQVVAIEKQASHFRALRENLEPFGDRARAMLGTLSEHFGVLSSEMGEAPALFFIDPFGIEPLRADVIRAAMARPYAEVLLLFADQAALRHFGVASAVENLPDESDYAGELFDLTEDDRDQIAGARAAREEKLGTTPQRCTEIMDAAFDGHDWYAAVNAVPQDQRRATLRRLYQEFLMRAGAIRVLPIPIRDAGNRHVYYLMHATKSPNGYATMKDAVETALRRAPLSGTATDTIRFLVRSDPGAVERQVRARFAGQTIRWAPDRTNPSVACVRRFALEDTAAYPSHLEDLKARLAGLRQPGKSIVYRFPGTR
jgi:three-Cys-motif partner protein